MSANSIKRIRIGEMYTCSITFFLLAAVFWILCKWRLCINYGFINISINIRRSILTLILLEGKIWMLETSFLSFAAIECLVSGFFGIRSIKERRKPSCKFRSNSLIMTQILLRNMFDCSCTIDDYQQRLRTCKRCNLVSSVSNR